MLEIAHQFGMRPAYPGHDHWDVSVSEQLRIVRRVAAGYRPPCALPDEFNQARQDTDLVVVSLEVEKLVPPEQAE